MHAFRDTRLPRHPQVKAGRRQYDNLEHTVNILIHRDCKASSLRDNLSACSLTSLLSHLLFQNLLHFLIIKFTHFLETNIQQRQQKIYLHRRLIQQNFSKATLTRPLFEDQNKTLVHRKSLHMLGKGLEGGHGGSMGCLWRGLEAHQQSRPTTAAATTSTLESRTPGSALNHWSCHVHHVLNPVRLAVHGRNCSL